MVEGAERSEKMKKGARAKFEGLVEKVFRLLHCEISLRLKFSKSAVCVKHRIRELRQDVISGELKGAKDQLREL